MAVLNAAFPILPGKYDEWRPGHDNFVPGGPKRAEWESQMKRYGITRQTVSIQRTPNGDFVVVFFEGDDQGALFGGLAGSDDEFDMWFAEHI